MRKDMWVTSALITLTVVLLSAGVYLLTRTVMMPRRAGKTMINEKLGFEITGLKNDWLYDGGKFYDEYTMQLIRK